MTDAPELLPCPFCGANAVQTTTLDGYRIECSGRRVNCPMNMRTHHFGLLGMAIRAWNTRADLAPTWQPIETAPLEQQKEEVFVLDNEGNVRMARWWSRAYDKARPRAFTSDFEFGNFSANCYWPDDLEATHWMPLPPAPEATQ